MPQAVQQPMSWIVQQQEGLRKKYPKISSAAMQIMQGGHQLVGRWAVVGDNALGGRFVIIFLANKVYGSTILTSTFSTWVICQYQRQIPSSFDLL